MFDPYREWLGVTDERRPPTLYQLLGISPAETHPQIIEHSVKRQMMRVQPFLAGPQADEAKRIIDELKLARATLLDPTRRTAYDAVFGVRKASASRSGDAVASAPSVGTSPAWFEEETPTPTRPTPRQPQKSTPPPRQDKTFVNQFEDETALTESHPSSADGTLPSVDVSFKRQRIPQKNTQTPVFIALGLLAAVGCAAGIYFAMKSPEKTPDDKKVVQKEDPPEVVPQPRVDPKPAPKKKLPPNPRESDTAKRTPSKVRTIDPPPPAPKVDDAFRIATVFRGHEGAPRALAIAPDGKQLLSVADDASVLTWNAGSEKPARRYVLKSPGIGAAYFPDGKTAVFCDGGSAFTIDLASNRILNEFTDSAGGIQALVVASDGKHFLTGCRDGAVRWWAVAEPLKPEHTIEVTKDTPVDCIALAKDGKTVVAGGRDGSMVLWDIFHGKKLKSFKGHPNGAVIGVAFSPDGRRIASVGEDKLGRVWDVASGKELFVLKGHEAIPLNVAYTPDGSLIISSGLDQTVRSWNALSGEPLRWKSSGTQKMYSLAIDPMNHFLIAGQGDGGIQLSLLPAVRPDSPGSDQAAKIPTPAERLPKPEDGPIEVAGQMIRERYKADFALSGSEDQLALVDKLVSRAGLASEDPASRFALFQEAKNLAVKLGNVGEALKVLDQRSAWFKADDLSDRSAMLRHSVKTSPTVVQSTINAAVKLAELAAKQARPDIVDELMAQQELFAQNPGEEAVNQRIMNLKKIWLDGARAREDRAKLEITLAMEPDNKEANLTLGKRLCFQVGDWSRGLAYLEKGGDDMLLDLVKKEKSAPREGKEQVEIADAWLGYADKADDEYKSGVRVRAQYWLAKAEKSSLPSAEKLKVAGRRLKLEKLIPEGTGYRPGEAVLRADFNTLRTATAGQSQWALSSGAELTGTGPIILKGEGQIRSRFKPQEEWKISFEIIPDGREIRIQVCGEEVSLRPAAQSTSLQVVFERKNNQLSYHFGPTGSEKNVNLAGDKQEPTVITLKALGATEKEGMKISKIIVNGFVKPTE